MSVRSITIGVYHIQPHSLLSTDDMPSSLPALHVEQQNVLMCSQLLGML